MSASFSKFLWFELRMPAKWGILECRHMWHSKFQSWVRKPQYFPIFEAKTCHKQFIDWPEIYPKAFQVPSSTPSCMIRIAWGNHVYPSEGFYQNRAPNLWTTGQKPLKCLHQKVSKRTSEACQNRKGPDTHSKLTSARAIYRKNTVKKLREHIFLYFAATFSSGYGSKMAF